MNAFYSANKKKEIRTFYIKDIKENRGIITFDKILVLESLDSIDPKPIPKEIENILNISGEFCTGRIPISIKISEREFIKKFGQDKFKELINNKIVDLEVEK